MERKDETTSSNKRPRNLTERKDKITSSNKRPRREVIGVVKAQPLLAKHRSIRSTLTSRIKEAIFTTFNLSSINSSVIESDIKKWKQLSAKKCYINLFKRIKPHSLKMYMSKIIEESEVKESKVEEESEAKERKNEERNEEGSEVEGSEVKERRNKEKENREECMII
ncbi:hypothetical protein C1645_823672 [Glomus cerebriforme]|uniref:Uncharacterized protein n=1 Tax=Glomus cerebriforme TaxID=658196 RepID=A0A397SVW7_9GLOM|nr:hypothetical protein C1645_823672 [Glomus cerebriforme]